MEKTLQQYKKKLQEKGHTGFDLFIETDPTVNKKYVRWIVDSYVNGGIANDEDLLSRLKPALESYIFLKSKNILSSTGEQWQQETNIDNFCGLIGCKKKGFEKPGIEDLLDKYKDQLEKEEVKTGESYDVYNGETIRIVQPTNKDAACHYGQGTRWCTAATKGENMFDEYNKTGPLYIILPKKPTYVGEKYQLSFGSDFYANEKDDSLKIEEIVKRYPEIMQTPLIKYFIPLDQTDLNDPDLTDYNIKRAIKEDNLNVYKHLVVNDNNLKKLLPLALRDDALEIFKYMVEEQRLTDFGKIISHTEDSPKIAKYLFETHGLLRCSQRGLQDAIRNNDNLLFDAFWKQCPFKHVYLIDTFHSDNAHAFSVMRSNGIDISANFHSLPIESQNSAVDLAVNHEAPNILEYLLMNEPVSQQDKFKIYSTLYTYFVEEPFTAPFTAQQSEQREKLDKIVAILYRYGMYDELPNYILDNPDRVVLLDHLNLDSRTNFEIINSIYQPESLSS